MDAIDLGRLRETLGASRLPGSLAAVRQWLGEQGVETTCGDNPLFWTDELGTLEGYCTAGPVRFGAAEVTLHFHFFQLGRSEPVTTEVRLVATDPRTLRNAVVSALGEPTTACRWSGDELWALNGGSLLVAGHTASLSPEAVACR